MPAQHDFTVDTVPQTNQMLLAMSDMYNVGFDLARAHVHTNPRGRAKLHVHIRPPRPGHSKSFALV